LCRIISDNIPFPFNFFLRISTGFKPPPLLIQSRQGQKLDEIPTESKGLNRKGTWLKFASIVGKKNQQGVLETRCGRPSSWSSVGVRVGMESDHFGFDGGGNVVRRTAANKKFGRDDGDFKKLVLDCCNESGH
jgi:hypothetical protein